jgi:hypothetical protein
MEINCAHCKKLLPAGGNFGSFQTGRSVALTRIRCYFLANNNRSNSETELYNKHSELWMSFYLQMVCTENEGGLHCKKRFAIFPSPAWMSLTKLTKIISHQEEFGKGHPGWGRENLWPFLQWWRFKMFGISLGLRRSMIFVYLFAVVLCSQYFRSE